MALTDGRTLGQILSNRDARRILTVFPSTTLFALKFDLQEYIDGFLPNPPKWSAVRISDYGYGHLNILNKTHIYWEQVVQFDKFKKHFEMMQYRVEHIYSTASL